MSANNDLLSPGATDRRKSGGTNSEQSLWSIMSDPVLKDRMFYFCAKQYSEENVLFLEEYITIYEMKATEDPIALQSIKIQLSEMYDKYFGDFAPMELNVPINVKKKVTQAWESITDYDSAKVSDILSTVFEESFDHIKQLVQTSVIIPFLKETRDEITNVVKSIPEGRKKVIILGGGFCGTTVMKFLRDCDRFSCILIDKKPYFESTPTVIQALANPPLWVDKISVPYEKILGKNGKFIQGSVHKVRPDHVEINGISIPFDYLVLCTGSTYKSGIKSMAMSTAFREKTLKTNYKKLLDAKTVLIVGGGLVGVELAAEFKLTYPDKHIIIVEANDRLMKRSYKSGSRKIANFLKKIKVEVKLNERVVSFNTKKNIYKTNKGEIKADVVYLATGIFPNTEYIKSLDPNLLDKESFVKTNLNLTMEGYQNIFVGGDIKAIKEEKLAKVGTADGFLITRNIINSELKKPLIDRGKNGSMPLQEEASSFVSLGPKKGVVMLRNTMFGMCFPPSRNQTWFLDFIYGMKISFTKALLEALTDPKKGYFPVYGTTPNPSSLKKLKD